MTSSAPPRRATITATVVDDAHRGRSTLLVAPPGGGRSTLLQQVEEAVRPRQPAVRRFTATPSGLFLGVLDAAGSRRMTMLDGVGRAALVRAAVLDLGLRIVIVDEAPLADPDSAALLLELVEGGTAVVAGATTGRPLPDALRSLFARQDATTVALPALDTAEIAAAAALALGGPVDSGLAAALERAGGGLPASLTELLREGRASGAIGRAGDLWVLAGPLPVLEAVRRRIAERWPGLAPARRTWLAQVAFAGSVADDVAVRLATDDVADWAERAGWTAHTASRTSMRTPVARAGVLDRLGARTRANAARQVLAALTGLPRGLDRAERLAEVWCRLELGEIVDLARADAVAEEFGLLEDGPAEQLLRAAVEHDGSAAARGLLAERLVLAGRADPDAPELADATEQDARRLRAGLTGYTEGDPEAALSVLGRPADGDGAALRSGLLRLAGRTDEALAEATALRTRSTGTTAAFANLHEGLALVDLGDASGVLEAVARLRADPAALRGLPGGGSSADWLAGRVAVELRLGTDDRLLAAAHAAALTDPQPGARAPFAHLLARIRLLQGDPLAAAQLLREAIAAPGLWARSRLPVLQADLATALAVAGDPGGADARLPAEPAPAAQRPRVLLARAAVAHARRDAAAATALAAEAAASAAGLGRALDVLDATYDGLRYGDPEAAARLLALPPLDGVGRALQRRHAEAVLTGTPEALEQAADALHGAGLVLHALEASAAALQLRAATSSPDREAVARFGLRLAAAPGLVLPTDQARRPSALTAREREVARLAATGLPDRLVAERLGISVRTAQTHLGRAFGKLGVHRRSELPAALEAFIS